MSVSYNSRSDNFLMDFYVGESWKQFLSYKFYISYMCHFLFRPWYLIITRETSIEVIADKIRDKSIPKFE